MDKSTEQRAVKLHARAAQAIWAGTVWTSFDELVRIVDATTENVDQWLRERKVFALERSGERYFPSYAFDSSCRPLSAVVGVMRIFKDFYGDESVAAWFESTSSFLGGARPREVLACDPERVLACAQHCVDNARHAG